MWTESSRPSPVERLGRNQYCHLADGQSRQQRFRAQGSKERTEDGAALERAEGNDLNLRSALGEDGDAFPRLYA